MAGGRRLLLLLLTLLLLLSYRRLLHIGMRLTVCLELAQEVPFHVVGFLQASHAFLGSAPLETMANACSMPLVLCLTMIRANV